MRVRAKVEYMGAAYAGWQTQPNQPTVQSAIEKALETVVGERIGIESAGRTDSGVHATGQVAAFDLPDGTDLYRLRASLNGLTADDVSIVSLEEAAADFDPRRDATARVYEYTIVSGRPHAPMLDDRSWFVYPLLNAERLNGLAEHIIGTHDFSAFRASDCMSLSTVRDIHTAGWEESDGVFRFRIAGNAFLKQMVRILVGTMVDVCLERFEEAEFVALLEGGDRTCAGRTAPAKGLVLTEVRY